MVGISHLMIDICKVCVEDKAIRKWGGLAQWLDDLVTADKNYPHDVSQGPDERRNGHSSRLEKLFLFTSDQLLHIVVIFGIFRLFARHSFFTTWVCLIKLIQGQAVILTPAERVLAILIIGLCATVVSSVIVQIVTEPAPCENAYIVEKKVTVTETYETGRDAQKERKTETFYSEEPEQQIPRGRVIGYFERLIVVLVVFMGAYTAIAFIVAAKSLARFKKLDHQEWAEYFLVGTLCSLLCGTLSGLALKLLLSAHP